VRSTWWARRRLYREDRVVVFRLVSLALVGMSLFVIVYMLAVRTVRGQALGNAALAGQRVVLQLGTEGAKQILETLGAASLAVGILALMAIAIVRRRPRLALATAFTVGASLLSSELLKDAILPRPDLAEAASYYHHNTFPSGHATAAAAVAAGMVMVVPRRIRGTVGIVGAIYAAVVGHSTLVSGWHRPSDVAGSAAIVLAVAATTSAGLVWWRGSGLDADRDAAFGSPLAAVALIAAGVALMLAGVIGAAGPVEALSTWRPLTEPLEDASFIAMSTANIGANLAAVGLLVLGLHGVYLDPPAASRSHVDQRARGRARRMTPRAPSSETTAVRSHGLSK